MRAVGSGGKRDEANVSRRRGRGGACRDVKYGRGGENGPWVKDKRIRQSTKRIKVPASSGSIIGGGGKRKVGERSEERDDDAAYNARRVAKRKILRKRGNNNGAGGER